MQQPPPAPPPALAPAAPAAPAQARVVYPGASPADMYTALRAQRRELRDQLERLEEQRGELRVELREIASDGASPAMAAGLEQRISELDARIARLDRDVAAADAAVAEAASVPGAIVEPVRHGPPEEVFVLGGVFMVLFLFPLTIAYARRIWRRGSAAAAAIPAELFQRLARLEQSVDAIAVEMERVGEGQRFMTRLFTEQGAARALGEGAAQPLSIAAREREAARGG